MHLAPLGPEFFAETLNSNAATSFLVPKVGQRSLGLWGEAHMGR